MTQTEKTFRAGFSRVNITPPLGISLAGHPKPEKRLATTVLDELEINTLAVSAGGKTAVLFSADLIYIRKLDAEKIRRLVAEENNIPYEAVYIACTHTHTGPLVSADHLPDFVSNEKRELYRSFLPTRFSDAARMALVDMKPAKMGMATTEVRGISFVRRYRMKDGSVRTNPGQLNPEILEPIGKVDPRVHVLRIVREGGREIAIANFGLHPDTLGGGDHTMISADYPRAVRETVETSLPAHCIFFNGAQGDINHINVNAAPKIKDEFMQKNSIADTGYDHPPFLNPRHIGRAIAGAVFQVYGDVEWVDVDNINYGNMDCVVPMNVPSSEELEWARRIWSLYEEGKNDQIPGKSIVAVTSCAQRMLRLEHGPENDTLPISAVSVGPAVFVGIPGEPFNGIGVALKENSPFEITLPCCLTNGGQGYFPMAECYAEGGYEADSSNFKAGVAERIIETGTELMHKLRLSKIPVSH